MSEVRLEQASNSAPRIVGGWEWRAGNAAECDGADATEWSRKQAADRD
ncbi:hypothetical protein EDD93_6517 [Streptomyces sp. 840.1]|nr:hypothetical protein EDD93_6517 [Streptomyces sp. 840.1]